MSKHFTLADLNPRYLAEVERQLSKPQGDSAEMAIKTLEKLAPESSKKRLRQSTKPLLNKLETRFHEKLLRDYSATSPILCQAVRLELARGLWYKPDFIVPRAGWQTDKDGIRVSYPVAFEVKGPKVFRGGFENLKAAARAHQWIRFYLVWEDLNTAGGWALQEILP